MMLTSFAIEPRKSSLNGLACTELPDFARLDALLTSSLLRSTFNNPFTKGFANEAAQLAKYKESRGKIVYRRVKGMSYGRVNPVGAFGLYSIRRELRQTLAQGQYVDIDIDNCHPILLVNLCRLVNEPCDIIADYVVNRAKWRGEVEQAYLADLTPAEAKEGSKKLFIQLMYHGNFDKWLKVQGKNRLLSARALNTFIDAFHDQIARISARIMAENPGLCAEVDARKEGKSYNRPGSIASWFFQEIECRCLEIIWEYMGVYRDCVLCADGLMVKADRVYPSLLDELSGAIYDALGLSVKLSVKEFTQIYSDDLIAASQSAPIAIELPVVIGRDYASVKSVFEKTHALIVNHGCYTIEADDGVELLLPGKFKTGHQMIKYEESGKMRKFYDTWVNDSEIRKYDTFGCYPPPLSAPVNILNLWKPFAVTRLPVCPINSKTVDMFLRHILILCDNDQIVADYLVQWIGQMFQYPAVKTIVPTLISEEGAGKGTLTEFISALMGKDKMLSTTVPSRDIWGTFNGKLAEAFFVNLNEMSKREQEGAEGQIKGLITDPTLTINSKGVGQYVIQSYHRFLITTNKSDPISTSKQDRRNLVIECSNELTRISWPNVQVEYFEPLRKALFSDEGLSSVYQYLMALPGLDKFATIPIPVTEYQEDMKASSVSYFELFVGYLASTIGQNKGASVFLNTTDLLEKWICFTIKNNIDHQINAIKLGLAMKRMCKLYPKALKKVKSTNETGISVNPDELRAYFADTVIE